MYTHVYFVLMYKYIYMLRFSPIWIGKAWAEYVWRELQNRTLEGRERKMQSIHGLKEDASHCPYCRQQAPRPTFCVRLTLQRTSLLALPQDPFPSCSILTFGRPSFADHPRAFFSSGDCSTTLFGRLQRCLFWLGPYSPFQI